MKMFDRLRRCLALRKLSAAQQMATKCVRESERSCHKLEKCGRELTRLQRLIESDCDAYQKKLRGRRRQLDALLNDAEEQTKESAELLRKQGVAMTAMRDECAVKGIENQLLVTLNDYKIQGLNAGISEQVHRQVLHTPGENLQ